MFTKILRPFSTRTSRGWSDSVRRTRVSLVALDFTQNPGTGLSATAILAGVAVSINLPWCMKDVPIGKHRSMYQCHGSVSKRGRTDIL